jgi:hypothetical protein
VESDDGNAVLRKKALKALQSWTTRLAQTATEGIEKGHINPRIDPLKLSHQIIASLEGALLISRLRNNNDTLQDMRRQLHSYLEQNVRAKTLRSKRANAS